MNESDEELLEAIYNTIDDVRIKTLKARLKSKRNLISMLIREEAELTIELEKIQYELENQNPNTVQ